jgi:hypothetical protein
MGSSLLDRFWHLIHVRVRDETRPLLRVYWVLFARSRLDGEASREEQRTLI